MDTTSAPTVAKSGRGAAEQAKRRRQAHRPLILVVEDDPHDWEIYGKMLWYNGFDCMYARDGNEALNLAHRHRPDVVVLDVGLPDMNGLDLCRRLKAQPHTAGVPVVFLTARSRQDFGGKAAEAGCARYIEKPAGPVDVLHAIEDIVGRAPPAGEGRPPRLSGGAT